MTHPSRLVSKIYVRARSAQTHMGRLHIGSLVLPCALGRNGLTAMKREGDQKTPRGAFKILYGYFRQGRIKRTPCLISQHNSTPLVGWCDDPNSFRYNRPIRLTKSKNLPRHEILWRLDFLYDLCFVLDFNSMPRRLGWGSAIFFHLTNDDQSLLPTQGCVALRRHDMVRLLPRLSRHCSIEICF